MRFMVLVKASPESEAGALPTRQMLADMGRFNTELVKAGVLLAAEGLHPSSRGARIRFGSRGKRIVTDGPFAETKELIAGYWLIEVKSMDDAIEWIKRVPFEVDGDVEPEIEIRQVFEAAEFGPDLQAGDALHMG